MSFNRNMAIWLKGREYDSETNMDGEIVITPKANQDLYATIDPVKGEAHYWQNFSEPLRSAFIPVNELADLRYFVELLLGEKK